MLLLVAVDGAIMEDFLLFLLNFCKDACELLCFKLDCEFLFFNTFKDRLEEEALFFKVISMEDIVSLLSEYVFELKIVLWKSEKDVLCFTIFLGSTGVMESRRFTAGKVFKEWWSGCNNAGVWFLFLFQNLHLDELEEETVEEIDDLLEDNDALYSGCCCCGCEVGLLE